MKDKLTLLVNSNTLKVLYAFVVFTILTILTVHSQTVVQYTTAGNHTFYVPFGVTQITVECWGGGGAGGGATSNEQGSAGGGGGAYARKVVTVTPCTYYSISVGAGGTTSTGIGGTGGTTRFGTNDVVAVGGTGGGTNNGGAPGVGGNAASCIGDVVFSGGNGASGSGGTSGGGGGAGGSNGAGGNASGITGGTGATVSGGNGANGRSNYGGGYAGSVFGGGGSGGRKDRSHIGNFWSPSNENGGAGAVGGVKITYTLNACNSMPNGGTANISIAQACSGTPFTISANCYSVNSGITYQWQSSPNGVNSWTNVSGATDPNTYSTNVANTTYYRLAVTCTATSQTAYSSVTHFEAIPCISMPNGTNSITTCAANFYDSGGTGGNYSNSENRTYTFYPSIPGNKIRVSFSSFSTENNYDGMMIYNGNTTAAPLISSGLGAGSNATTCPAGSWRGTVSPGTVTSTAVDGSLTFVFKSDGSTTSSGWIAEVSCAPPCSGVPNGGTTLSSMAVGCQGYAANLSVSSSSSNSDIGITYQWQSSPTASGPWSNIAGANSETYTATVNSTIYYRRLMTCVFSGESDGSDPIQLSTVVCPDYNMPDGQTINTCAAYFYDSGGSSGSYGNNQNRTTTFCADSGHVRIDFSSFSVENGYDYLYIYDGPTTGSPLAYQLTGVGSGANMPPIIVSTGQCITFRFTSDGSTTSSGWAATVSCTQESNIVARNFCGSAPHICNLNGYTGVTSSFYLPNTPGNMCGSCGLFDGSLENNSWISFTATGTSAEFDVQVFNCSDDYGIQMGVYSGVNCDNFSLISDLVHTSVDEYDILQNNTTTTITVPSASAPPLVPGQTYYIMIDGYGGDVCSYSIEAISGIFVADLNINDTIICEGEPITLIASGGNDYVWSTGDIGSTITVIPSVSTTYRVTVSGGNPLCPDSYILSAYIDVQPTPTASITGSSLICEGDSAVLTASGGLIYDWSTGEASESITVYPTSPSDYVVTVTSGLVCTSSATHHVDVQPKPTINLVSISHNMCGNNNGSIEVSITDGSPTYNIEWDTTPISNDTSITGLTAGDYTIIVTDQNSCSATETYQINDLPGPTITLISAVNASCGQSSGSITISVDPPTGISFQWSTGDTTQNIANLADGDYTVTVTDANNCTATQTFTLTMSPGPTIDDWDIVHSTCGLPNGSITLYGDLGSAPTTYTWSPNVSSGNVANNLAAGDYSVTISDANSCSTNATFTINDNPGPTVTHVSITDDNCNTNTGQISFTHTGGTAPVTISWNTTPVSNDTIISNLPAGSYTLTLTDSNSCVFTATYQIISIAGPAISNSTITNATCNQSNGGVNIVINSTQDLTYQWSTTPAQTSQNLSGVPAGQYTVTVTDENGCTVTGTYTVGNTSGPTISNFNITQPACGNSNGAISITTTGGAAPISYSWNTTPPQTTAVISGLAPGSYTVVVTDGSGCTISATYSLQDIAAPQITQVTKVDETCSASNGSATVIYTGGTPPINIIWTTSPPQNTPTVNNLPAGTYTVTLRDANNCTATQTVEIIDFPSPLIDGFTSQNEMCDEQNGSILVNYTGGTAPITFEWNTNPVQNTQEAINLVGGDYSVTITDANSCSTIGFWSIINHPKPTNEFTNIYMDTCIVGAGKVSAFPSGGSGIYSYNWNTTPAQNSQSATNLYPGIYTVVINDGFCTITDSIEIIGIPGPNASFTTTPSLVTMKNPTVRFTDQTPENIVSWNWYFGDGFQSSEENPAHVYHNTGEYDVIMIVTDNNGCIDTARGTVVVDIDFGIWIPNAFTPNEDGKNERFGPHAVGFMEKGYSMKIFDRWGRLVFETTDFYTRWDGTDKFSGKQRDVMATYVYEIFIVDNLQKTHRFFGKISAIY